jgi:hypothetical protein
VAQQAQLTINSGAKTMYEFFDDPYIYGPLTKEEFDSLAVNHRMLVNEEGYFIGVSVELSEYSEREIVRPPHVTNPSFDQEEAN